jgi:hypothetical protein
MSGVAHPCTDQASRSSGAGRRSCTQAIEHVHEEEGTRDESFKELLMAMPDVGDDVDFERLADLGQR